MLFMLSELSALNGSHSLAKLPTFSESELMMMEKKEVMIALVPENLALAPFLLTSTR